MALQATILARKRRGNSDRRKSELLLVGDDNSFHPSWFPKAFTEGKTEKAVESAIKIQKTYRAFRDRQYAKRVFFWKSIVSSKGFRDVSIELKKLHMGFRFLCSHFLLFIMVCVVAYLQLMYNRPKGHELDLALMAQVENIQFAENQNYLDVISLDDIKSFAMASIETLHRVDPQFTPSESCEEIYDTWTCHELIMSGMIARANSPCANITEYSAYLDPHNRMQAGLLLTQQRFEMGPCESVFPDSYANLGFYQEEHGDVKCAQNEIATNFAHNPAIAVNQSFLEFFKIGFVYRPAINGFANVIETGAVNAPRQSQCAMEVFLDDLQWIDRATKQLCLSLLVQNRNGKGRFGYFKLCFNIGIAGKVTPTLEINSGGLWKTEDQIPAIVMTSLYALLVAGNIVYFFLAIYQRFVTHSKTHRFSFWGMIFEGIVLGMNAACVIMYGLLLANSNQLDPFGGFTGLDSLLPMLREIGAAIVLEERLKAFYCFLLIFMTLRTIILLDFHVETSIISQTLLLAGESLLSFAFVFLVVVISYAYIGMMLYGKRGIAFQTMASSMHTLFFISMGDFEAATEVMFNDVMIENDFVSKVYFWTYLFLTTLILFNVLLSIVVDAFVRFTEEKEQKKTLSFLSSVIIYFYIVWYDCKHYYGPKICFCCMRRSPKTAYDVQKLQKENQQQEQLALENGVTFRFDENQTDPDPDPDPDPQLHMTDKEKMKSYLDKPHKYLDRLRYLRTFCRSSLPTFLVRKEFAEVFPIGIVDKLLAICRDRTGTYQHSTVYSEEGMFFRKTDSHLYTIELLRQVLSIVKKSNSNIQQQQPPS